MPWRTIATVGTRVLRIKIADSFKENAVARHRVVDPRGGQNALAKKSKSRNRNSRRYHLSAALAQSITHHFRSRNISVRKIRYPQDTHTRIANENIAKDDTDHSDK